jgi:hypothetical protein
MEGSGSVPIQIILDPDPRGTKTHVSYGSKSGSGTLAKRLNKTGKLKKCIW